MIEKLKLMKTISEALCNIFGLYNTLLYLKYVHTCVHLLSVWIKYPGGYGEVDPKNHMIWANKNVGSHFIFMRYSD